MYNTFIEKFHGLDDLKRAKFLKAKALFNLYSDEQMYLHENADLMALKDLTQKLEECYEKVKELIILLGDFIDDSTCQADDEIHTMLDSAMMDYMHETNQLHELQRCYLCYRKVGHKAPHEQNIPAVTRMYEDLTIKNVRGEDEKFLHHPQAMDTEIKECELSSSRKRGHQTSAMASKESLPSLGKKVKYSADSKMQNAPRKDKLIKSHLFPRAILDRFAHAVPLPNDSKVIVSHMPGLAMKRKHQHSMSSPRTCTLFMLYSACENTLSGHGESQFVSQFFDQLYNTKDPPKSTGEQVIK